MTVNRYGSRSRDDRRSAIAEGVMRHFVGGKRVTSIREAKEAARVPVAPKVPVPAKPAQAASVGAPAAVAAPADGKRALKIDNAMLAAARNLKPAGNRKRTSGAVDLQSSTMFTPWEPPKGVLPAGMTAAKVLEAGGGNAKMAMDYAEGLVPGQVGAVGAWAGDALNVSFAEGIGFLGYSYLAALTQRAEYRRISERLASEMTRKWIKFHTVTVPEEFEAPGPEKEPGTPAGAMGVPADPEEAAATTEADQVEADKERVAESVKRKKALDKSKRIKELEDEMRRLRVKDCFYTIAEGDGWFGRYHLYVDMGVDSATREGRDELVTPIGNGRTATSKGKVNKRRRVKAFRPIEPMWCYPAQYNSLDPLKPDWYNPEMWYVNGVTVHRSRLLRFVGREVPDILKPAYAFGGLSMSQMAKPYVDNWLRTRQAVCDLIESFSVSGVYTNLSGVLEEGNAEAMKRIDLFNVMRSNAGAFVLDKETEEFFNVSTPLGTLDALQAQSQEQMSSVSGIPLIVLLGITPKGLNASSEGELRAFYDTIQAEQERFFRDNLQTVINFIMLSLWGEIDEEITFSFEPLWSMTDKELAETQKVEAETDGMLIDKGIITPAEARVRVANDPQSAYQEIDPADVPEPPQQDMGDEGGDDPFGGGGDDGGDGGGSSGSEADKPIANDEWNEADHPRGQPGNAGQFGPGGGSSKSKPQDAKPKKTSAQTQHSGGQKLKMPQYGLTGSPWEAHQKPAGVPKSEGKPTEAGSVVVFKNGEKSPSIGGPKFKQVDPPESWEGVSGDGVEEPELPKLGGRKLSAGVLIREPDGRVWMVRPTGGFGGYEQTFPKGRVSDGLSTQDSAIKEAYEETGLAVKLTGFAGDAKGDTTITRFYYAERVGGDPADAGREAEAVILAPVDRLHDFLNRSRDKSIADHLAGKDVDAGNDDHADQPPAEQDEPEASLSIDDLKKVGGKLGSNEGGQYEDADGNKYYVKKPKTKDHVANEKAAARLYQLAGVQTLDYVDIGPDHVATKWDKLDKNNISKMSADEKKAAAGDFMVHAWLSNWDAAGTGGDNQGVKGGKPVTLDVGGSLRYRAQGGEKGKAFGSKVSEIETMRDPSMSPDAARLYGKMSDDELRTSAERVTSIPDSAIREAAGDEKLADTLIARKKDIASRYDLKLAQDAAHDDEALMKAALDAVGANLDDGDDGSDVDDEEELDNEQDPGDTLDVTTDEEPTEVAPDVFAFDEGQFDESKIKRDADGKFATTGASGGKEGEKAEGAEKAGGGEKPEFKSKKEHIGWLLEKGTTPKEIMTEMGWPSVSMQAQAANLGMKLEKKDGKYFGTKMSAEELAAFKADLAAKKAAKQDGATKQAAEQGAIPPAPAAEPPPKADIPAPPPAGEAPQTYPQWLGAVAEAAKSSNPKEAVTKLFKDNPEFVDEYLKHAKPSHVTKLEAAAPGLFEKSKPKPAAPEASPEDKAKAKKSVALQMQYVKANAKPETATYKKMADDLLKDFNDKWTGKEGLSDAQLNEKVQDFKDLGAAIAQLSVVENKQKSEILKAEQEKAAWEQKQAKEKEEKELAEAFAKDPELKLHHEAMEAMFGGGKASDNYLAHAQKKVNSAGLKGKMSAHEAVPIVAYSGSHYAQLNSEIRSGSMSVAQYKFLKSLNAGLDKLPAYEGTTYRKAPSGAVDLKMYQPGKVVEERGFTSSSKNKGTWHGDVQYTIHGKTGRDIQKLSSHPGEAEVLFKSGTRFYVESVQGTHITLREL